MEGEGECDELELLLGEIPNAAYDNNPPSSAPPPAKPKPPPVYVNHTMGMGMGMGRMFVHENGNERNNNNNNNTSSSPANQLPDDHSLTCALSDLTFHNVPPNSKMAAESHHNHKGLAPPNSKVVLVSSAHNTSSGGGGGSSPPNSNVVLLEQLNRSSSCQQPPIIIKTTSYDSHLSPPIPIRQAEPEILWRQHFESNDRFEKTHHQYYLYLQQLRSQQQQLEAAAHCAALHATRLMSWNLTQDISSSFSHQQQQQQRSHQMPYWNKPAAAAAAAVPRSLISPHPPHRVSPPPPNYYFGRKQARNHPFPEKILTRSQGVNSLRPIKLSSSGPHETPIYVNHNGGSAHRHLLHFSNLPSACSSLDSLDIIKPDNLLRTQQLQKYNTLEELTGRIHLVAKDQHGCRFLQRKFAEGSREDVLMIFDGIIVHILDLMIDPFGNYLVQKLLEVCDEDQRMKILIAITKKPGELVRISCDMHGTRAVQKVVETLKTHEQSSIIVSSLKPGIVALIKNMNGNHVAQRCLQYLMPEFKDFLFEAAIRHCVDLATDRHGCCVLQKCLSYSDGEQRRRLIHEITSNALILSQDPFGNYVVQFVFELGIPWATVDVVGQLENNYCDMSVQKYSSNVVEKCLKYGREECRSHIIEELIKSGRLDQIMQDPYGNYVIQAALDHAKGASHGSLVDAIRPHIPVLRTSPYGKKVLSSHCLKK